MKVKKKAPAKKNAKRKGHITAIANQKGGVGKTTTAHALVAGLTIKGYKALAVDIDPQANLTYAMKAATDAPGTYELMIGEAKHSDVIQRTEQGDIIASNLMLAGADMDFNEAGREYLLKEILEPVRAAYDYIIIDSPPTLGILTLNALTAADDLIIPLGADAFSLQGFAQLHITISKVQKRCNSSLKIAGLLITRHAGRTTLGREVKEIIEKNSKMIKAKAFKTVIRESVAIREAQFTRNKLYDMTGETKNNAITDYMSFVEEYIKGAKNA
jgi:chromosome partitioning protein